MFCSDKWIWTLANFFCTLSFLVQLFDLLPSYFAPTMTNTQISNEQLKNIDFPLDIQICVNPLLNTKALQEFGFSKVTFYQMGAFSNGTIGWGGLDNETGAMASGARSGENECDSSGGFKTRLHQNAREQRNRKYGFSDHP